MCSGHAAPYCLRIVSKVSSAEEATDDGLLLGCSWSFSDEASPPSNDGFDCNLKNANARRGSTTVAGYTQDDLDDELEGVSTTALVGFEDFGDAMMSRLR